MSQSSILDISIGLATNTTSPPLPNTPIFPVAILFGGYLPPKAPPRGSLIILLLSLPFIISKVPSYAVNVGPVDEGNGFTP